MMILLLRCNFAFVVVAGFLALQGSTEAGLVDWEEGVVDQAVSAFSEQLSQPNLLQVQAVGTGQRGGPARFVSLETATTGLGVATVNEDLVVDFLQPVDDLRFEYEGPGAVFLEVVGVDGTVWLPSAGSLGIAGEFDEVFGTLRVRSTVLDGSVPVGEVRIDGAIERLSLLGFSTVNFGDIAFTVVPEPGAAGLLCLGLAGLACRRRLRD